MFRIECPKNRRLHCHVEATLVARDPIEIIGGIDGAPREGASTRVPKGESKTIEMSKLDKLFGEDVMKMLKESRVLNSVCGDLDGNERRLQIADDFFSCNFEEIV